MAMNDPYGYSDNQGSFKNFRTDQAQTNQNQGRASSMPQAGSAYTRNMQPHAQMPSNGTAANQTYNRTMQQQTAIPPTGTAARNQMMPSLGGGTPTTVESTYYTAGLLRKYIGENVRVEFLIGSTAPMIDRTGILQDVGASYIILRPSDAPENDLICDLYSIKFVNVIR
ncbi:MAG: hypothetical protein ACYCX2_04095 [Christensenellales bacterium]